VKNIKTLLGVLSAIGLSFLLAGPVSAQTTHRPTLMEASPVTAGPFADNNGQMPLQEQYPGPLFKLNPAWPQKPLLSLQDPPWQVAIHGHKITTYNASAYANALKAYVSQNAKDLIMNYDSWDASKARWFNEPWLGSLREAIHGTYPAGEFGPGIFPETGLRATFNTHVLTYYDERAAYSLYKLWGVSAMKPNIQKANSQFAEGSVIVKAAVFAPVFATTDTKPPSDWWDAMKGAQEWPLFISSTLDPQPSPPSKLWSGYVAQFDIIVKDSKSSPKTGWVFMTLVYDGSVPGDVWDKMIPLGAQWGNDPQATKPGQPLVENWINPNAPKYSKQTLGWGGRLSGPNDGAHSDIVVNADDAMTPYILQMNEPNSSCMSCHSTAQWNVKQHKWVTFLLPSIAQSAPPFFQLCGHDIICSPKQASSLWMKWYQNRLGTQPMDPGSIAMDFDLVFSFKSLPMWWKAMNPNGKDEPMLLKSPGQSTRFNQYTGAPIPGSSSAK
jgi:hypothetical protein